MRKPGTPISDADLEQITWWPPRLSAAEIRQRIKSVTRFVDYDETLLGPGMMPRDPFCGRPLHEFLAEQPYIVVSNGDLEMLMWTFNVEFAWGTRPVEERFACIVPSHPLPLPVLIMHGIGSEGYLKDFAAMGVESGEIYDDCDMGERHIYAPGCTIITKFD